MRTAEHHMVRVKKMDRITDINFIVKAGRVLLLLLVLTALSLWPASSVVPVESNSTNNSSLEKPSNCSWTGKWNTYFGNMTLVQTGNKVTGTYEADGGRINGNATGNRLLGNWSDAPDFSPPAHSGNLEFNLSADCNSFSGRWRYGSEGNWSDNWSGLRIQAT
jgi:hypothetical protein